jgi:hypothetical protein
VTGAATRGSVAEAEAADAVAWLLAHLTPIRVLEAGARELPPAWRPLDGLVETVVCDPLVVNPMAGAGLVTAALSVHGGAEELNVTRDPARSSLLEPNHAVLARHGGAADFEVRERRAVPSATLSGLAGERGPFDVLRLTTRGTEYSVLSSAVDVVPGAVCIDVVGGLIDNYIGQYPLGVVAALLHGLGYSLVDLDTWSRPHRTWGPAVRHAPVEYRGLWLKDDLVHGADETGFHQAVKLLVLSKFLGYHAFGHRLAVALGQRGLLRHGPARTLAKAGFWKLAWSI